MGIVNLTSCGALVHVHSMEWSSPPRPAYQRTRVETGMPSPSYSPHSRDSLTGMGLVQNWGQAATAVGGNESLTGWNLCPNSAPSVP
jgi:hypothetical protein